VCSAGFWPFKVTGAALPAILMPMRLAAAICYTPHNREAPLADPHQVNSIIATAIFDVHKEDPEHWMEPDQAKQIAKCIIQALTDAGFKVVRSTD
jgi:hypothetical protein